MTETAPLAPCPSPWCSNSDPHTVEHHRWHWYVECRGCGQRGPGPFVAHKLSDSDAKEAEATAAWNTRPTIGADVLEVACRTAYPALFGDDKAKAHRVASPATVEWARQTRRAEVQAILTAVAPHMQAQAREDALEEARQENYKTFTDGMEAAAEICGSLAETTYDDADGFEAATGCEASIMAVVRQQRKEQARALKGPQT